MIENCFICDQSNCDTKSNPSICEQDILYLVKKWKNSIGCRFDDVVYDPYNGISLSWDRVAYLLSCVNYDVENGCIHIKIPCLGLCH